MANQGRPPGPRGGDAGRSGRGEQGGGPRRGGQSSQSGRGSGSAGGRDSRRADGGKPGRDDRGKPGRDDRGAARGRAGQSRDSQSRDGRPPQSRDRRTGPRDDAARTSEQARYDGPTLDESITGKELDRSVAQQLKGLPEKLANRVAKHLVAAAMLLDEDPKTAYQHTLAARARAARIAVVREACGEAAYAAGEYAEALSELRAAKRMNGSQDYLPVMADCERALGRPERALALAQNPAVAGLPVELKAEMTIVEAGARRDLGEVDAALRTLENAPLRVRTRADWVVRLRYAYADTLLAAGRTDDAIEWFHRTVGIDGDEVTDAAERVAQLEGQQG